MDKRQGKMNISHDELYKWLTGILQSINEEAITDAFLYSLSSRDVKYQAYLASYVFALSIPAHSLIHGVAPSGNVYCRCCGHFENYPQDTVNLDFELFKWGGVRVNNVFTATYYLDRFLKEEKVKPQKKDFDIFNNIIDIIVFSDEENKPRDLEKLFGKIIKSNKGQREMLINQLGIIGVLETHKYKGFHEKYIHPDLRELPAVSKIDWFYPVCWWRGKDKINFDNFNHFFGHYPELKRYK